MPDQGPDNKNRAVQQRTVRVQNRQLNAKNNKEKAAERAGVRLKIEELRALLAKRAEQFYDNGLKAKNNRLPVKILRFLQQTQYLTAGQTLLPHSVQGHQLSENVLSEHDWRRGAYAFQTGRLLKYCRNEYQF